MTSDALHTDRARAESFGAIAAQYDRFRPGYPEALFDDLVALQPGSVLDVGCGTGKAAVALADRGLRVLGVEPDARMAAVARSHGIPVEVATLEDWDDAGRQFDLIVSGQAWHWIDPARGVAKAARLLRPGGTIARFWDYSVLDQHEQSALDTVYRDRLAKPQPGAPQHNIDDDPFDHVAPFGHVSCTTYSWERVFSAAEWVSLVATHSDHQLLAPAELAELQQDLHAAIERLGGRLHAHGGTYTLVARRTG